MPQVKKQPARATHKLTAADKRQINAVIRRAKGDGKPRTAQQSIPYLAMYPDGLCRVTDKVFSKSVEFSDISYQLAGNDDKTATFENLCDFYNYFDSSIAVQFSFVNLLGNPEDYRAAIDIPPQGDDFDDVRAEYSGILREGYDKGANEIIKRKYLSFAIENDSPQAAKARLERIKTDIHGHFRVLGSKDATLSGHDRLKSLFDIFHPDGKERFAFDWGWLAKTGLSTKDFIAPTSFAFGDSRTFRMGNKIGAASFLQILAPELNDRLLADFLDMESSVIVSLHIRSIDQTEAIKMVKRKITDLDSMKIAEQKKAVRSGYDMDILPSDLSTYGGEAKNLLRDLQSRNERMFLTTFLVINLADTKEQLENNVFTAAGIAQKHNCALYRLDNQQEKALMSALPLGMNYVPIERGLTTSSTAIFVPFTTGELFQTDEALYYGRNALSGNMIMADRKRLKNPNGLILGTPGSGKSFSAKREITNAFLITTDDILICDPEAEYAPLVERLKGQVIRLSPTGRGVDGKPQYVNPMDINLNYSDEENPVALKSDFILSFCEVVAGGRDGLHPIEKTVIDKAVRNVYREYLADPDPARMPILEDLYNALKEQPEIEAQRVAAALEIYVHGSLNIFNHRTNVDISNRLVCFDIKELGKQLKTLGMLVIQDQIWNRVTVNRAAKKATRYYCDEFHLLLKGELGSWSVEIWKRFRKWGGIPTGITQNIKDLLASAEIENIFENSDFLYLLNQAAGDREILCEKLRISPKQAGYITHSEAGEGLIIYGSVILPFIDRFPTNTRLYEIMTTRPLEATRG
ncbi:VirB4-like conjugal transfer ATPase, CD1110 family [[Clostridium] symbiosum]|uniref:VirB4-like conjugal transfer ATPase, CD1110 family n=1 Tax=Clostridium symbiosum TaxID=1512 RepID=UPI001A9B88CC|nr:ATP-binding protein [[Clostridium] symbiosum]